VAVPIAMAGPIAMVARPVVAGSITAAKGEDPALEADLETDLYDEAGLRLFGTRREGRCTARAPGAKPKAKAKAARS